MNLNVMFQKIPKANKQQNQNKPKLEATEKKKK